MAGSRVTQSLWQLKAYWQGVRPHIEVLDSAQLVLDTQRHLNVSIGVRRKRFEELEDPKTYLDPFEPETFD